MGCSGGKLTREEGGTTPRRGSVEEEGGTVALRVAVRTLDYLGGRGAGCMGVAGRKNCGMSGKTKRRAAGAEGSGGVGRQEERGKGSLVRFRL